MVSLATIMWFDKIKKVYNLNNSVYIIKKNVVL